MRRLLQLPSILVNENGNENGGRFVFLTRYPFSFTRVGRGSDHDYGLPAARRRRRVDEYVLYDPTPSPSLLRHSKFSIRHFPFRPDSISVARIMNYEF